MSRLATSFVLGYHGCDERVGRKAVQDGAHLLRSEKDFDWLGPGSYFWEADPQRALEWARWKVGRGGYQRPYVVGAVIDLGNCLDLTKREDLALLREAHDSFLAMQVEAGLPPPENRSAPGRPNEDRVLRYLDCAVIRHLHKMIRDAPRRAEPYDTVRGMFVEGPDLYAGSGFKSLSHAQVAVCNDACVKGVFVPRPYPS